MFKVGDTVRNVARNVVGVVTETDGDVVYLEQPNGCEVNFPAAALVLESAFQARHDTTVHADAAAHRNDAVYDAVLARLYPSIIAMGRTGHAGTTRVPGVAARSWEDLSSLQKLNAVSAATDVPVKAWIDSSRPGAKPAIGALQLSVLAATGRKTPK
jgi:hypothetical protein